ncbi:cell envelope biogenesis protein TolA [Bradyrhizobium sp. Arg237L]|uniref:cell envelope biogenesis protein TolA n=1 Tax=Bradyrhizobium sp. Arg237L TaxID=3003352 RepID=UPI0032B704D6
MAAPDIVLRRPVGSNGPFKEHADLPTDIGSKKAGRKSAIRKLHKHQPLTDDRTAKRKAALAFEREQKRRDRQRAKEEAARQKERERRQKAVDKAQNALDAARRKHEKNASQIQAELEAIEERSQSEKAHWEKEKARLEAALRRAQS